MPRDMMASFELYQPDSVDNAIDLLGRFGEDGWPMAGGHDTLDWFKDRVKYAQYVVDLTGIAELRGIRETPGGIEIGALTTLTEIEQSPLLQERYRVLGEIPGLFLGNLLERRRYGKHEATRILGLLELYRKVDLTSAIERAQHYGAFSFSAVERILGHQADPRPPLDALSEESGAHIHEALGGDGVEARSTADYQHLLED